MKKAPGTRGPKGYPKERLLYSLIAKEVELFQSLVISAKKTGIIDGSKIVINSTKLSSYEASKPKKDIIDGENHPNWGMKRDTNGNNIRWF